MNAQDAEADDGVLMNMKRSDRARKLTREVMPDDWAVMPEVVRERITLLEAALQDADKEILELSSELEACESDVYRLRQQFNVTPNAVP